MIFITRLNGSEAVINAELIQTIESTPDTMLTMLNGEKVVVKEAIGVVVERVVAYKQRICLGKVVQESTGG